jgi:hypothetical protein
MLPRNLAIDFGRSGPQLRQSTNSGHFVHPVTAQRRDIVRNPDDLTDAGTMIADVRATLARNPVPQVRPAA